MFSIIIQAWSKKRSASSVQTFESNLSYSIHWKNNMTKGKSTYSNYRQNLCYPSQLFFLFNKSLSKPAHAHNVTLSSYTMHHHMFLVPRHSFPKLPVGECNCYNWRREQAPAAVPQLSCRSKEERAGKWRTVGCVFFMDAHRLIANSHSGNTWKSATKGPCKGYGATIHLYISTSA